MKLSKQELEAVIAASPRSFVPFDKLVLSPTYQARPENPAAPLPLSELAASIEAAGLLHNLVVVRGARGLHEVCAGGRRLRAMALLVEQGRWAENQPVPVLVVPAEQALMASLIENVEREALNPADEFAAFARLIDGGRSVEDVAAAFGVTPQVVKRRLKLAAVSPALLKLFREGGIGLDCLMVLASLDDPARQEQLWQQLPEWNRSADQLRRLLTRGEVESDRDGVAIIRHAARLRSRGRPAAARPVQRRRQGLPAGCRAARTAGTGQAAAAGKPGRRRRLEVGRRAGPVRLRGLRASRRGAPRASSAERRGGDAPCATRSGAGNAARAHAGHFRRGWRRERVRRAGG
jgi:ParB/RepB/Spo0J family partition protein